MSTALDVDLDIFTALQEALNEEQPCEHPNHDKSVFGTHAGPGEWYANIKCPECKSYRVYVICDPFKQFIESDMETRLFWCNNCTKAMPANKLIVNFTKTKGGSL